MMQHAADKSKGTGSRSPGSNNAVQMVQARVRQLDGNVKAWLKKQPAAVEVALVTAGSAVQGGAIGALMGTFTADMASSLPPPAANGLNSQTSASLQQARVPHSPRCCPELLSRLACPTAVFCILHKVSSTSVCHGHTVILYITTKHRNMPIVSRHVPHSPSSREDNPPLYPPSFTRIN